jgi:hypothetical protein
MPQHSHQRPVQASSVTADVAVLLDSAQKAIEAFTDRRVAIANGYRLVGRDLPSMGEHWLNTRLLIDGVLDVSRPELLTYVKVDGRPVLTGVVYAIPLQQGQAPPSVLGPQAIWHEHNGAVDDEALLPEHHNTPSAVSGTRVAFVHAWLRVPHPDGLFAAENWAMPFVRAGLPVPEKYPDGAARALGLLNNGRRFFADLLGSEAAESAAGALDECAELAAGIAATARATGRGLTAAELDQLDTAWGRLLKDVASRSGVDTMKRINGGSELQ